MFGVTSIRASVGVALARFPLADLLLGLVLADAVRVLDLADELVALAGDGVEVVVGQLAPLRFHGALRLLPVSCDAIPVHVIPFSEGSLYGEGGARSAAERGQDAWLESREEAADAAAQAASGSRC